MKIDKTLRDIVPPNTVHSLKKRSADRSAVTINDTAPTLYLVRAWQEPGTPSPFENRSKHKKKRKTDECEELHREGKRLYCIIIYTGGQELENYFEFSSSDGYSN